VSQIRIRSNGNLIADKTEFATSPWTRFRGLMLRSLAGFQPGQALVIDPCTSIHMFFMRFPIDVLYLNRENVVVRAQKEIRPWRIGPIYTRGARFVVELPAGTIARSGVTNGDAVAIGQPGVSNPDQISELAS
jgi:uncharacterized protein